MQYVEYFFYTCDGEHEGLEKETKSGDDSGDNKQECKKQRLSSGLVRAQRDCSNDLE